MKFAFVVLHYLVEKDTIECIDSILHNISVDSNEELYIIMVDNGSPNQSYTNICAYYNGRDEVIPIQSDRNLGFANGNNIGFRYAKEILKADYIVLINNDTIIEQNDCLSVIHLLYNEYKFAVLGPDIMTCDGQHQNPFKPSKWTLKELQICRLRQRLKYVLTWLNLDWFIVKSKRKTHVDYYIDHDIINADLHGACLVFSREYIDRFDGLCDKTFLYMEEEILKLYLDYENLRSLYSPKIQIIHKEDMATNAVAKSSREKKLRQYQSWINSSYVYEEIYKKLRNKDD